jgi:predicted DCC family thiol-disulfide oxidoreductase YuxK
MAKSAKNRRFRLFFDGACPLCSREIAWLKRRDRAGNLRLEDISSSGFDPARYGLTREELDRVLHGIRCDGKVVRGMDAVREAYRSVGLGWLLAPTRLPGVKSLSDLLYGWFASNRHALGRLLQRHCEDGRCVVAHKCEDR